MVEEADVVVEDADVVEGVDESEEAHNMNFPEPTSKKHLKNFQK